ncbi:Predicted amidohydrolase [Kushneria avicenniae]|uniref:Predicted amidohydrolase n=1 Tax=Kushneria avicenniae TaxID=402385 RepID=A0A1I1N137_9GAMM|nr:carbon-nitrogen hydrolase family protein [Kushneria avicenniae]SFC88553.1 Predicted amidohydrolase [Kushneria avicenniae]
MPSQNAGSVVVALAQMPVLRGAVAENLATHLCCIERAAEHGADVVAFPELSLIGYESDLLAQLAMSEKAEAFTTLSDAAMAHHLVVVAGCPLVNDGGKPYIGAVICFPDGARAFYAKQHLHDGEAAYCAPGHKECLFTVNGVRIVLAVCADFVHPAHAEAAAAQQAQIYLVSAMISEAGYDADAELLAGIARRHRFPVLLSNHISRTGGWQTCGKSGGWDTRGEPLLPVTRHLVPAQNAEPSLVICALEARGLEVSVASVTI